MLFVRFLLHKTATKEHGTTFGGLGFRVFFLRFSKGAFPRVVRFLELVGFLAGFF